MFCFIALFCHMFCVPCMLNHKLIYYFVIYYKIIAYMMLPHIKQCIPFHSII